MKSTIERRFNEPSQNVPTTRNDRVGYAAVYAVEGIAKKIDGDSYTFNAASLGAHGGLNFGLDVYAKGITDRGLDLATTAKTLKLRVVSSFYKETKASGVNNPNLTGVIDFTDFSSNNAYKFALSQDGPEGHNLNVNWFLLAGRSPSNSLPPSGVYDFKAYADKQLLSTFSLNFLASH